VQTNNATFNPAEAHQQLAMVRLRAVEHGREALMASTVGVSALVDSAGRVRGATEFNTAAVVVGDMRVQGPRTLSTRLAAWPELAGVGFLVAALVGAGACRRGGRRPSPTIATEPEAR
jgi:apolipoprotein N-acyltransferase